MLDGDFALRYYALDASVSTLADVDFSAPATGTGTVDDLDFFSDAGGLAEDAPEDRVAHHLVTSFQSDEGGVYTLTLQAEDEAQVFVDGVLVLDSTDVAMEELQTVDLHVGPGEHVLEVLHLEIEGEITLDFDIARTGPLPEGVSPGDGLFSILARTVDDQRIEADHAALVEEEAEEDDAV